MIMQCKIKHVLWLFCLIELQHEKTSNVTMCHELSCPYEVSLGLYLPTEHTAKTLIRLDGCEINLSLRWAYFT